MELTHKLENSNSAYNNVLKCANLTDLKHRKIHVENLMDVGR